MTARDAKWVGRASFAEVAECLDVGTDTILAAYEATDTPGEVLVLWTPEFVDKDSAVLGALLVRNQDGIFEVASRRDCGTLSNLFPDGKPEVSNGD